MRKFFALYFFLITPLFLSAQKDSLPDVNRLLKLSLEELMNVQVVTASGYLQTTSEAPSTVTVISTLQIAERGYEQLEDALRDVPGIDMIHINGYAPTLIYFRGMYGAENLRALLMIDGIVENNILGSNDMAGPAYSLHNVERIEIIWGPVSALYGANAFGGVINIITKKGGDMNNLHFEQGLGSFNSVFQNLSMGFKKDKFEFSVAGSMYSSDGPKFTNRDPNYTGSYVDKAKSLNVALSYYGKDSKTTVGYRSYTTPMGWGTYSNSPTSYLGLPSQGYNNQGTNGILQRDFRGEKSGLDETFLRTAFLQQELNPGERLDLMARVVYRETGVSEDSYIYVINPFAPTRLIRAPIASYSNRVFGEVLANYSLSEEHKFSLGLQFFQDNVEAGQGGSRPVTVDLNTVYLADGIDTVLNLNSTFLKRAYSIRNNFGSFFQYVLNTSLLTKTSFTFGLRYDRNSYFGDNFSPRIAVVNQPNDKLTFKLQFGKAFRSPTNLEIYQTPSASNFQLKQEKINTYEANAIYSASKKLRLQLNGFYNHLTDVIIIANLNGLSLDKNPGVFTIYGVEAIGEMILSKNISAFSNITWQHGEGKNLLTGSSGKLPGIADIKGNAGITAHIKDLFIATLTENWVGERHAQRSNAYGDVKGYLLTNCSLRTTPLFKEKITVSMSVRNVFNVKWLDPGFRTADGMLYSSVLEQPGINGTIKLGITL